MRLAYGCLSLRCLLQHYPRQCYSTYLQIQKKYNVHHISRERAFFGRSSSNLQTSSETASDYDFKHLLNEFPQPKKIIWKIINEAYSTNQKSEIKPTMTVQQILSAENNQKLWQVTLFLTWPEKFQVEGIALRKVEAENLAYLHACQKMKEYGMLDSNNKPALQKNITTFGDSNLKTAKGSLCNIYQHIWTKLGKKEYIPVYNSTQVPGIFEKENYWKSELHLKYPEKKCFIGSSDRLRDAEAIAAVKALHWLFKKGVIDHKKHWVSFSKEDKTKLLESQIEPCSLCIPPMLQEKMKDISQHFEKEKDLPMQSDFQNEFEDVNKPHKIRNIITEEEYVEQLEEDLILRSREMFEKNVLLSETSEIDVQEIKKMKLLLPINHKRADILRLLHENQVVVLSGETGCGKTTQVPQFILEDYINQMKGALCNIVVTQPRRISAISIAERVAKERNEKVGETIGYQVRLNKNLPQKPGSILYCTTGMLLRKLCSNPNLEGVSHIIVDEIHERNIQIDFLLILLKKILEENRNLKLLMMSASFNTFIFSKYFNNCPVVHVPGKVHPVKEYFLEDLKFMIPDIRNVSLNEPVLDPDLIVRVINYIDSTENSGAILCFLPGWQEIQSVYAKLLPFFNDSTKYIICFAHSRLPHEEQKLIFKTAPPNVRKIILATNIAETSITVNDVVYVINCGLQKETSFDSEIGIASLATQWITKANVRQRRGRAGRVQAGVCYHLFSRKVFMEMEEYPLPELLRMPLESVILDCKLYCPDLKAEDFLSMALQPPSRSALQAGVNDLQLSNIFDENENLTALGQIIVKFGTHPHLSVALVYAAFLRCLDPVLTICAMLTLGKEPFINTLEDKSLIKEVKKCHDNYLFSDHLSLTRIFDTWDKISADTEATEFLEKNFLDDKSLSFIKQLKRLFAEDLFDSGIISSSRVFSDPTHECNANSTHVPSILAALTAAFYPNVIKVGEGEISHGKLNKHCVSYSLLNGQRCHIQRESVVSKEYELPSPWLIYFHALQSEARRMVMTPAVSSVPSICLALFAGKDISNEMSSDEENVASELSVFSIDNFKTLTFSCTEKEAELLRNFRKHFQELFRIYLICLGNNNSDHSSKLLSFYKTEFHPVLKEILETPQVPFTKGEKYKFVNNILISENR